MRNLQRCTDTTEEQSWAAGLPVASFEMVEDEKFETVLSHSDMRDLQCRSDAAEEIMDRQLWAAGHSEVLEAAAENDKNEEVLAGADRRERQKRMQPSLPESPNWIDNCEDGVLDGKDRKSVV